MKRTFSIIIAAMMIFCLAGAVLSANEKMESAKITDQAKQSEKPVDLGSVLPIWSILPFVGILLSIALFPLLAPHFWHNHFEKVSAFWALAMAVPFVIAFRGEAVHSIAHIYIIDYIPFIILLWSLFTVSGGIYVKGSLSGTPMVNTMILLIGTLLASLIGTTGASMLMIRPMLKSNSWRQYKVHSIVFFIFLISNIGGALTPLGDPPLFLGFLHGVPFFWTMKVLPHMGFASGILLALYFIIDTFYYKKETKQSTVSADKEPLKIEGLHNFIFLGGIVGGVLFSGLVKLGEVNIFGIHQSIENLLKDLILIIMGLCSLATTTPEIRKSNEFTWGPILEVAYLFAGIFMTIIPALAILLAGEHGALSALIKSTEKPAHYFWAAGSLSSFLDNAPTYLTFFSSALGKFYPGLPEAEAVSKLIVEKIDYLVAISAGAVFMGANTYIGNAPNFMVKSIAEEAGVKMPSFFGYMFKYSIPILVVLFIIITFIFF
jgi:Na+/H+ antiporter NhaD/arsenite permease-like protein